MVFLAVFLLCLVVILAHTACLVVGFLLARRILRRRYRHEEIGLLELLLQEVRDLGD